MKAASPLDPGLYDKDYYLHSLPEIEYLERGEIWHPALIETLRFGQIKAANRVLDFGCGRGVLTIAPAQKGCTVVGLDFSRDAIEFAHELCDRFPKEVKERVEFKQMTFKEFDFEGQFDVLVFNQVYEHLHDWELEILIPKFSARSSRMEPLS